MSLQNVEVSVNQMDMWTKGEAVAGSGSNPGGVVSSPQASLPQLAAEQVPVDFFG